MKLPTAEWRRRRGLDRLLAALDAEAGKTRFVGGAVRDTLLGLPVNDLDCATMLLPDEVMRRLREVGIKGVPTGIAHGTVTAVLKGGHVEITTLRRDLITDGRRATVAFSDDWREDAARRDFTINALSADPASGEVHDYFGGLDDLAARRIRFIGDPLQRIAEDHLRILRFFRFHARFGEGVMDEAALAACAARADDLKTLSAERIAGEFVKLLALPDPTATVRLMVERGIWRPVLPDVAIAGVNALERLIVREAANGLAPSPIRRLAALLPADPEIARAVAARLRLSNADSERLRRAAERRADDVARVAELSYRVGETATGDRLLLADAAEAEVSEALTALATTPAREFPMKGGALVELGLEAGLEVTVTLNAIERRWIDEGFPDGERVMEMARQEVGRRLRSA